ncbi:glucosaminidase domain-containing protein [Anaerorhabdus sp.]|uniref:N-acetylglucosaminidase n=1 Tax=Anaerorhabdus sp. TaxID=1872524 RepID=UPI002B1EB621|nr:glucosaminidase domain-containing protein [Anaerorhabdus sp.]MEA4875491.1 glucosaminidase domain-containing protein [Anaerorhabdus sp.]
MVNRIIKLLLSISMIAVSFTILDTPVFNFVTEVQADYYGMGCSNYEVATANANGTFTKQNCYNSFAEAQNAMGGYGENAVVRHSSSKSPTKIISMVGGIAVTYPMRSGSSTMNITQDINHQYRKVTYVTKHREMKYDGTTSYNGAGNGTIKVNVTGFSGVADLVNVDLVPYIFLGNDTTVWLGGNDTTAANEQPFNTHIYQAHYEVTQNGAYKELTYYAYSGWSDSTWPAKYTMTVGLAADWMTAGTTYYSYDGYNFYSDSKYKNKIGTYYNYYQFLPSRTKSNVSASVFDNYLISVKGSNTNSKMKGQGQTFINAQNAYGINALLVYSLACLESAYGTSDFALNRNNLFGWNAFDSDPGSASYFSSVEAAINEHMGINLRGYTNIEDSRFFGSHVGNKGSGFNVKYAADPYWGYKIAAIAYSIDKASGFADLNKYSVGVINTYGVNILKSPGGATLFNSAFGATYQENFTVAVLANESNHYKIQSTNPVSNGNIITGTTKGLVNYDWNQSIGYIPTGYVTMTGNSAPIQPSGTSPTGDFVGNITSAVISADGKLTIEGNAYRPGIHVTDTNKVVQTLLVTDSMFNVTSTALTSVVTDKDKIKYNTTLDLNSMVKGDYYFKVKTEYSTLTDFNQEFTVEKLASYPAEVKIGNKTYKLYDLGGLVKLSISDSSSVTPQPTPTPPLEVKKILIHELSKFERVDNELIIKGVAFISGINAKEDSNIKHEIYFTNLATQETLSFNVQTTSMNSPISMGDGYIYKKVLFEGKFDVSQIPEGNYVMYIKVTNGADEKRAEISNYYNNMKPNDLGDIRFIINPGFNFRYEMRKENLKIDFGLIKKPSVVTTVFDFFKLDIVDGKLGIDGISWISDTDTIKSKNPAYKLLFVDKDGNVIEKGLTNKTCKVDYGKVSKYKFSTIDACFEQTIDLADLPNGSYNLMLDVSIGEYRDIIEMYDYDMRLNKDFIYNNKNYHIGISPIRSRITLTVSDVSEIKVPLENSDNVDVLSDLPNEEIKSAQSPLNN